MMKRVILNLKSSCSNYLLHKYEQHVNKEGWLRLPVYSPYYRFISEALYEGRLRTVKRPAGNLSLVLPAVGCSKNSVWYYLLSKKATLQLEQLITRHMRQEVHRLMRENKQKHQIPYARTVSEFTQKYDLPLSDDAFLKSFQRLRQSKSRPKGA